ncbi:MAG: hypothetical protein HYT73_02665 [Candidatus Aenigmarchaeota archaeon]|nr:hypothetical protein [Candidatus Aenigmarchaeota archaeon]
MVARQDNNFEYKVEFEDGLRPAFAVYGVDIKRDEFYRVFALVDICVGAGYEVLGFVRDEDRDGVQYRTKGQTDYSVSARDFNSQIPRNANWEDEFLDVIRKQGMNCIKVGDRTQINPAVGHHADLYAGQFEELERRVKDLFKAFIIEHPGYGYEAVFPKNNVL